MKKIVWVTAIVVLIAGLMAGCAAPRATPTPAPAPAPTPTPAPTPAPAPSKVQPIELKAVTFLPRASFAVASFFPFMDKVNKAAKGELTIKYLGGPEVVPQYDQAAAVQKGVVDITHIPPSFYATIVPVGKFFPYSELTPAEERAAGVYDFFVQEHKKAGFYYLGRGDPLKKIGFYFFFLRKRAQTPADLAGRTIHDGLSKEFMLKLGINVVTVDVSELYSAMERGLIGGYVNPLTTIKSASLQEVTKYCIDLPLFNSCKVMAFMKLDTWNRLPKNLQDVMTQAALEVEQEFTGEVDRFMNETRQLLSNAGCEFYKFSPADEAWWYKTSRDAEWEMLSKDYPELASKLRYLLTK